jgi:hypothetical protein
MSQDSGIHSQTADDDKNKQALLILLTAMCYADSSEREYILFAACRYVYQYSHAFDIAGEEFVESGYREFSSGKWKPQTDEATPVKEEENPLDLSKMCKDFLKTNDTPKVSENEATEAATVQKNVSESQDSQHNHFLGIIADKLSHVLDSRKAPDEIKHSIQDILLEVGSDVFVYIFHPKLIKHALPLLENAADKKYFRGILTSLQLILDNVSDELKDELTQYEKRYESKPTAVVDDLNKLAAQISEIMNNPLLPERLYNVIGDEIAESTKAEIHTPDNVLHNLKILRDQSE